MSLFSYPRLLGCGSASLPAHVTTRQEADIQAEVLALFDALRDRLLRYAVSFGLTSHDAEDVLQEAFLALFRHLLAGRSRENLPGWLYRTTHNLALKRRAAVQFETKSLAPLQTAGAQEPVAVADDARSSPEEQYLFHERNQRLQAVMRALPEIDQVCLRLRADGLRYRDIAAIAGISLGSVAASLARSLERMQRMDTR